MRTTKGFTHSPESHAYKGVPACRQGRDEWSSGSGFRQPERNSEHQEAAAVLRQAQDGSLDGERSRTIRRWSFTLIELMLVVIIIGALVAMVMPRFVGRGEQAKVAAAKADIQSNIASALKLYELDNGNFPSTDEGLSALLSKPSSASNWNGPYLERKPVDPWGREYKYKCPGEHRTADYDLYSLGKDGVESADDVKNWE